MSAKTDRITKDKRYAEYIRHLVFHLVRQIKLYSKQFREDTPLQVNARKGRWSGWVGEQGEEVRLGGFGEKGITFEM